MRPVPNNHPRAMRRVGDHRIELVFLSTTERDAVYEQLCADLGMDQPSMSADMKEES